jgi:(2R)-ethylmalonyl-CoA mutase
MYETGITDWPDIFEGSHVIEAETERIVTAARTLSEAGLLLGYERTIDTLAHLLARRIAQWQAAVESGERVVVAANRFTSAVAVTRPATRAPRSAAKERTMERSAAVRQWRDQRDQATWQSARTALVEAARNGESVIEPSVVFARSGGTTGEWTTALLEVWGPRYAAPLGTDVVAPTTATQPGAVDRPTSPKGSRRRLRVLLAKAGLDGHVNALRVLAYRLRQEGAEVVYMGVGQTPRAIARAAVSESVDVIGISSLGGGHLWVASDLKDALDELDCSDQVVVFGGIIPDDDHGALRDLGVRHVFTTGEATMNDIVSTLHELVEAR